MYPPQIGRSVCQCICRSGCKCWNEQETSLGDAAGSVQLLLTVSGTTLYIWGQQALLELDAETGAGPFLHDCGRKLHGKTVPCAYHHQCV